MWSCRISTDKPKVKEKTVINWKVVKKFYIKKHNAAFQSGIALTRFNLFSNLLLFTSKAFTYLYLVMET